ncbi:DUF1871 family protein [Planomicrobium sp. YIM 101495]|uniref:DUF1871 family protein n=1 Tax=Planomicrobium sp. YIM 101495 TaxID=2665160 RepID=UPI0012B6E429|nr:DUF1871 family protein [Planomicrobium sp. YIM 101495]
MKKVVDKWDPIDLLAMDCPPDEYDPEIRDIVKLLDRTTSADELAAGIRNVFIEWFGEDLTLEKCQLPAIEIWSKTK